MLITKIYCEINDFCKLLIDKIFLRKRIITETIIDKLKNIC